MSVVPRPKVFIRQPPYSLVAFDKVMAPLVARWVGDDLELFWLAPKTEPPLTPAKVVGWPGGSGNPMLLYRNDAPEPLGYLELNPMPTQDWHWWIGHCLVNPELRGEKFGQRMVQMALEVAFVNRGVRDVSLVVFPDNAPAIQCYRNVGFYDAGQQRKFFPVAGRQYVMNYMTISRKHYLKLYSGRNTAQD